MNYGGNRESDNCHKLKEFSFTWLRSIIPAVSHDIQQKHTVLHSSSGSSEAEETGGRGINERPAGNGLEPLCHGASGGPKTADTAGKLGKQLPPWELDFLSLCHLGICDL